MSVRIVAVLAGAGMIAVAVSGRAAVLVRPWFVPVLAATGLLLLVSAVWTRRTVPVTPAASVLLLLPVVGGLMLSPGVVARMPTETPADGAAVEGRIGEQDNPLLSGGDGRVTLLQIVLAERALGVTELHGRAVEVEAAVANDSQVSRLVMVCCAADARPVALTVDGALPEVGTWVRIRGRLTAADNDLVLELGSVEEIAVPDDPLL